MTAYIDAFKRAAQNVRGITDDEKLDRFTNGLQPWLEREVLRENPTTFNEAVLLVERFARV